ncbi:MAG TPA: AbrB/MazE/SpoVT family DNA-binding domain-containing protein [Candidatus Ruania gallistercoris]|uniref:AbrB/MazE/SpoVT family DNA-binding domain-containing protein n=1 Tax=Candidatus Ruania gallistercoris TaxID=2838746 RepID=A0A9D2EBT4_9MICO|nr:AbrB/MazE/SpoVT family DNA-binding domain-containing protein [Candidatus Ruania gallistercoris]
MTSTVGPKGQVVIPKNLRDEFGIEPGDEVVFTRNGDQIAVTSARPARALKGRFRGRDLTGQLERDRAEDRVRERSR